MYGRHAFDHTVPNDCMLTTHIYIHLCEHTLKCKPKHCKDIANCAIKDQKFFFIVFSAHFAITCKIFKHLEFYFIHVNLDLKKNKCTKFDTHQVFKSSNGSI